MTTDTPRALDHTRVIVAAGPLVGPVFARTIAIHASRADLPLDRVHDALLLADALAARAPIHVPDGSVGLTVQSTPGRLEIRVGPLRSGSAERLLAGAALPEAGRVVERLADKVRVRGGAADVESLVLHVDAPR